VQLLRVQQTGGKWIYEVCPEGAQLLESYGNRRIAVASICGLYRTGKSYILNLLLERVQKGLPLFQVGNTCRACTEGLWLWGSLDQDSENSPLLAFIDCEGFGSTDSDKTRDAQLMTLCALLSSVLVLNTKGALNESLFGALSLTCRFAEHIEERGNEASRPALMWVLRDFQLDLLDPNGRPISPSEYLEQALRQAPLAGHNTDRGQAAQEVRESLLRFFLQRSCHTLVRPATEEEQLQDLARVPYADLRDEFKAGVLALRTQLVSSCHTAPKAVGGHPLGCTAFVALTRQLVESMNTNAVLSVKGAWETVQHAACTSLTDDLRAQACGALRALANGKESLGIKLPVTDEAFNVVVRRQREELKAAWDKKAVGDESVRQEYWNELQESLEWEETAARERNTRLADQKLNEACRAWLEWLDEDGSTPGDNAKGEQRSEELCRLMEQMPNGPLCRAAAMAIHAAQRRKCKEREAIAGAAEKAAEAAKHAESFSNATAERAAVRVELDAKMSELEHAHEKLKQASQAEEATQMELQARDAELQQAKAQNHASLQELDSAKSREHDLKAQLRAVGDQVEQLRAEVQRAEAAAAKAESERLASESAARMARLEAETGGTQRQQLEGQVEESRGKIKRLEDELKKTKKEHETLQGKFEVTRREWEDAAGMARKERDAERAELQQVRKNMQVLMDTGKSRDKVLEEARQKLTTTTAELETARSQTREESKKLHQSFATREAKMRDDIEWAKAAAVKAESKFLASEKAARKARWEADTAIQERTWLEGELKRLAQNNPM